MSNKSKLKSTTAPQPESPERTPARTLVLPDIKQAGEAEPVQPQSRPNGAGPAANGTAAPVVTDTQANCGNCLHFITQDGISGECRGGPPTTIIIGVRPHPITGQNMPVTNGFFPPTHKDIWCGRWNGPRRYVEGKALVPVIAFKEVNVD